MRALGVVLLGGVVDGRGCGWSKPVQTLPSPSTIVELSQIGDTMLPILYVHKREDEIKRRHEIVANPVSYVHLKRTLADFIKIQLVNQKREYIEKSDTETVIVLHFKRS